MEKTLINDGNPTTVWHGYTHMRLLTLCREASVEETRIMAFAASLMLAGECTVEEWEAAENTARAVEKRMCEEWEKTHGEPRRNRHGQYYGGHHPGLEIR